MRENLPKIIKENIFTRIVSWFKNLFRIEEIVEEPVQDAIKEINSSAEVIKKNSFKESIQIKSRDKILALQRKLKEKQIEIADLTDQELDEMIELFKVQIEEKKNKLSNYRNKLMKK